MRKKRKKKKRTTTKRHGRECAEDEFISVFSFKFLVLAHFHDGRHSYYTWKHHDHYSITGGRSVVAVCGQFRPLDSHLFLSLIAKSVTYFWLVMLRTFAYPCEPRSIHGDYNNSTSSSNKLPATMNYAIPNHSGQFTNFYIQKPFTTVKISATMQHRYK